MIISAVQLYSIVTGDTIFPFKKWINHFLFTQPLCLFLLSFHFKVCFLIRTAVKLLFFPPQVFWLFSNWKVKNLWAGDLGTSPGNHASFNTFLFAIFPYHPLPLSKFRLWDSSHLTLEDCNLGVCIWDGSLGFLYSLWWLQVSGGPAQWGKGVGFGKQCLMFPHKIITELSEHMTPFCLWWWRFPEASI